MGGMSPASAQVGRLLATALDTILRSTIRIQVRAVYCTMVLVGRVVAATGPERTGFSATALTLGIVQRGRDVPATKGPSRSVSHRLQLLQQAPFSVRQAEVISTAIGA
jgi:hypothetical protein